MPNVWRLTLELEQVSESGIDFSAKSTQVIFHNDGQVMALKEAIRDSATNAWLDITGKHIRAKRARAEEKAEIA